MRKRRIDWDEKIEEKNVKNKTNVEYLKECCENMIRNTITEVAIIDSNSGSILAKSKFELSIEEASYVAQCTQRIQEIQVRNSFSFPKFSNSQKSR